MAEALVYGARTLEEQHRNQAKLGTRWQAKPLTEQELQRLPRYPRPLSQAEERTRAWWRGFLMGMCWKWVLVFALLVGGCAEVAHKYQRTVWGIDCRAGSLDSRGQCTAVR